MYGTARTQAPYAYQINEFQVLGFFGRLLPLPHPPLPPSPAPTRQRRQQAAASPTRSRPTQPPAPMAATNLPSGLQVTSAGVISGTPSTSGSYSITLQATNATGQTGTATLNLTVNAATPVITSANTATATAGSSFSYQITSNPTASTYGATNLPSGLQVTSAGVIFGYTFHLRQLQHHAAGHQRHRSDRHRNAEPHRQRDDSCDHQRQHGNGDSRQQLLLPDHVKPNRQHLWRHQSAQRLQVTSAGVISGTPSTSGSYSITLQATNATGQTGTATLNLTVNAAAPHLQPRLQRRHSPRRLRRALSCSIGNSVTVPRRTSSIAARPQAAKAAPNPSPRRRPPPTPINRERREPPTITRSSRSAVAPVPHPRRRFRLHLPQASRARRQPPPVHPSTS